MAAETKVVAGGFIPLTGKLTATSLDQIDALKRAIEDGIVPGPRLFVAGRAIVATGFKGFVAQEFIPVRDP